MAQEVIKTTFKLRRGLSKEWETKNPVLAEGEPGWAIDIKVLKIGDGIHPWSELIPIGVDSTTEINVWDNGEGTVFLSNIISI